MVWAQYRSLSCPAPLLILIEPYILTLLGVPQSVREFQVQRNIVQSFLNLYLHDSSPHFDELYAPLLYRKETYKCFSVRMAWFCCDELTVASKAICTT